MSSEIETIPQIVCSLLPSTYLIYNFNYSFTPQNGSRVRIYFVTQLGTYQAPLLSIIQASTIQFFGAQFVLNVYPIKYGYEFTYGRRVMWVEFVDATFKLDNYYIALTGTACGFRIYQLGTPVDTRTVAQQVGQALDPLSQQIANFTQFLDVEYGFNDFLAVLKQILILGPVPAFDTTFKKSWIGTFKEVLNNWCAFYNLSWYYENNKLNIIDPTKIILNFSPSLVPQDIIEYEYSESLEGTYGNTVSQWYQQQGGDIVINGAGGNIIVTSTMYPLGQNLNGTNQVQSEINNSINSVLGDIANIVNNTPNNSSAQIIPDPNQVAAALYGKRFWFLYNYFNGTASTECGWTPVTISNEIGNTDVLTSLIVGQWQVAVLDEDYFEQKYQSYIQFAQNIAGRYYVSNQVSNIDDMRTYQWYNVTNGQIFDFTTPQADSQKINMEFALSQDGSVQALPGTVINQFYDGIKYVGNVMYYKDTTFPGTSQYILDDVTSSIVNQFYVNLIGGTEGTNSVDFSELNQTQGLPKYIAYRDINGYNNTPTSTQDAPPSLQGYFSNLAAIANLLQPQFSTFNVIGSKKDDVNNLKVIDKLPSSINIVDSAQTNPPQPNSLPISSSNLSILRVPKDGGYVVYYNKISNCISAFSDGNYFKHIFKTKNISSDIPTPQLLKISNNSTSPQYSLNRDLSYVNAQMNMTLLNTLAAPRTFNTIDVMYKFNYVNLTLLTNAAITNGLIGLDISISSDNVETVYKFSNSILDLPIKESMLETLELQLKPSWTRNYFPQAVYTTPNDAL